MFFENFLNRNVGYAIIAMAFVAGPALAGGASRSTAASSAHGETDRAASGDAQLFAPSTRNQSALFRVSREGQVSYLFGTIHVGTKSFYPLAPTVSKALNDADQLVVELDTRANDAFQRAVTQHAAYPAGESVVRHVAPDTLARLTKALHEVGIPLSSVSHLKPWLLANYLMGLELERSGFERIHGNEFFLLADAQTRGTAIAELESADYQLSLFDTLSAADSERYLNESLEQLGNGTSLRRAKATIDAWNSGDVAALDAVVADATDGGSVMSEFTRRMLLGKRNPQMAARIETLMQSGKTSFVGVGLLHLLGADSLPQLLAQRGYQVERVN
ncbi:MAG: TraB/GumN family protein [Pseudomonadota bacterium]